MAAKTRSRRVRGLAEDYGPTTQTLLDNQRKSYQAVIEEKEHRLFVLAGKIWRLEAQLRAQRAVLNKEERDAIQAEEKGYKPWHDE